MKKLVVLSGAGVSAESGIATFRGSGGLWEGYDIAEVATPDGWKKNFKLVLDFYNARRQNVATVLPNEAHLLLASLQETWDVHIITQNIDDLHERAGSKQIVHLHGEITKACSEKGKKHIRSIGFRDLEAGELCPEGFQMRPYIVWFGEDVPLIPVAAELVAQADVVLIIGTSLEVYPANGLVHYAPRSTAIYVIDPNDVSNNLSVSNPVIHIQKNATLGMRDFVSALKNIE
jgi:NAD-dependent deacetylase